MHAAFDGSRWRQLDAETLLLRMIPSLLLVRCYCMMTEAFEGWDGMRDQGIMTDGALHCKDSRPCLFISSSAATTTKLFCLCPVYFSRFRQASEEAAPQPRHFFPCSLPRKLSNLTSSTHIESPCFPNVMQGQHGMQPPRYLPVAQCDDESCGALKTTET